eukprot:4421984-Prymnesium_polylepis.1
MKWGEELKSGCDLLTNVELASHRVRECHKIQPHSRSEIANIGAVLGFALLGPRRCSQSLPPPAKHLFDSTKQSCNRYNQHEISLFPRSKHGCPASRARFSKAGKSIRKTKRPPQHTHEQMGSSANVQQLAPAKHSAAGKSLLRDAIRATTAAVHLKNSVAQTFKEVDDAAPNMICRTPN